MIEINKQTEIKNKAGKYALLCLILVVFKSTLNISSGILDLASGLISIAGIGFFIVWTKEKVKAGKLKK